MQGPSLSKGTPAQIGGNVGGSILPPVVNVTLPATPQPTLNELELAFHKGADAQKRQSETVVPSGTKYTDA